MDAIQLLNKNKQQVGVVTWAPPGLVKVTTDDASLAADLGALVEHCVARGLPLRGGERTDSNGRAVLVERVEVVLARDPRFLVALLELINRTKLSGQRVFGVIVKQEEGHHAGS